MKNLYLFLGGVAVGAVAALLMAPESGSETRARIKSLLASRKNKLDEEGDELQAIFDQITSDVNEE